MHYIKNCACDRLIFLQYANRQVLAIITYIIDGHFVTREVDVDLTNARTQGVICAYTFNRMLVVLQEAKIL